MIRPASFAAALLGALGLTATAAAQHAPLIERMADANSAPSTNPAAPVSASAAAAPATAVATSTSATTFADLPRSQVGDTTRALLQLQADSNRPGTALPMLGEAASRSYQRYLDSFDHPIPEYFEAALPNPKQGGGSR